MKHYFIAISHLFHRHGRKIKPLPPMKIISKGATKPVSEKLTLTMVPVKPLSQIYGT